MRLEEVALIFVDELPEKYVKKSNNFIEESSEDFDFNQDLEFGE